MSPPCQHSSNQGVHCLALMQQLHAAALRRPHERCLLLLLNAATITACLGNSRGCAILTGSKMAAALLQAHLQWHWLHSLDVSHKAHLAARAGEPEVLPTRHCTVIACCRRRGARGAAHAAIACL